MSCLNNNDVRKLPAFSDIKIAMNHMLSGEDGDLKLAILEALYGENPTVEEFLAFMYVVVQKDLKEDLKKTAS